MFIFSFFFKIFLYCNFLSLRYKLWLKIIELKLLKILFRNNYFQEKLQTVKRRWGNLKLLRQFSKKKYFSPLNNAKLSHIYGLICKCKDVVLAGLTIDMIWNQKAFSVFWYMNYLSNYKQLISCDGQFFSSCRVSKFRSCKLSQYILKDLLLLPKTGKHK